MSEAALKPGIRLGGYPQRRDRGGDDFDAAVAAWFAGWRARLGRRRLRAARVLGEVERCSAVLASCGDGELDRVLGELRAALRRRGLDDATLLEAFALVRELSARTLGKRHFDTQVYAGWLMIHGQLAEMQTGEGKTLAAALAACAAALAGIPVHVITANDYLAARDCETLQPLYRRLGLTAAAAVEGMTPDACRAAYRADIVHTTNKQLAFDYLRDRIEIGDDRGELRLQYRQIRDRRDAAGGRLLLRGLCFAIVDEADSVLIDEADTPLIITRTLPNEESDETYADALYLASTLVEERDFRLDAKHRGVELTVAGEDRLEEQVVELAKSWRNKRRRESLVRQALAAKRFYRRDRDYLVVDGKVQIVDQPTGRLMPDRAWEQGLHQMIEASEGCVISERREPQARISYQRFFGRYLRVGGTSGTLGEVAGELRRVYGLGVFPVATHRPSRRIVCGERIYLDRLDQQVVLLNRVGAMHRAGRPVLIGTASVEESERVATWLHRAGLGHRVLNARQDRDEAEIVAGAGHKGAITVATNMAGRGTDIALGPGVEELGGLHVISLNPNPSRRVDRQLYGRCARQGDPGSCEAILSLDDPALAEFYPPAVCGLLRRLGAAGKPLPNWLSRPLLRLPQRCHERRGYRTRKRLTKLDRRLRRTLAFAGRFE